MLLALSHLTIDRASLSRRSNVRSGEGEEEPAY